MSKVPIIGTYCLCNTAAVLVHELYDDSVLASINGGNPAMYEITERQNDEGEWEDGFLFGEMFLPFSEVMKVDGENLEEDVFRTAYFG